MSDDRPIPLPAPDRAKSRPPRRLSEVHWSEQRGALLHAEAGASRRGGRAWLGLTRADWTVFGGVALVAFAVGLVVLRMWG